MVVSARFDAGKAAEALAARLTGRPEVVLVLGSGLSSLAEAVEDPVVVPFPEVPGFPDTSVVGHAGRYVGGRLEGRDVLVQAGRFHLYEGHAPDVVCGPVRVAHRLGARALLLTNAAGGVNPALGPGTLMLLEDHLNLTGTNPLTGPVQEGEIRFPDLSEPYDPQLRALARRAAEALGIPLGSGVYAAVAGPSYETPAEVRALARWGADAVGMSTVPEAIAARHMGMAVAGISCITNAAAGVLPSPLRHDEVMETAARVRDQFVALLDACIARVEEPVA
jgi:purine-nucleoside phosphorylase